MAEWDWFIVRGRDGGDKAVNLRNPVSDSGAV